MPRFLVEEHQIEPTRIHTTREMMSIISRMSCA